MDLLPGGRIPEAGIIWYSDVVCVQLLVQFVFQISVSLPDLGDQDGHQKTSPVVC